MKKKQTCKNCGAGKRIYVKAFLSFYRTEKTFCTAKKILVDKNGSCGFWRKNPSLPPLTEQSFDRAQENAKYLEKFFTDVENV